MLDLILLMDCVGGPSFHLDSYILLFLNSFVCVIWEGGGGRMKVYIAKSFHTKI